MRAICHEMMLPSRQRTRSAPRNWTRFAAQYSARGLPCERFTAGLADRISCITRGRGGWLNLPRGGLSPPILCQLVLAHSQLGQNEPCHSLRRHGRSTSISGPAGPAVGTSGSGQNLPSATIVPTKLHGRPFSCWDEINSTDDAATSNQPWVSARFLPRLKPWCAIVYVRVVSPIECNEKGDRRAAAIRQA